MVLPNLNDDPYRKLIRPLVENVSRARRRHIRSLRQFDVIAPLGDRPCLTCAGLSAKTLVAKGPLTGILDRLVHKGLIPRDGVKDDRNIKRRVPGGRAAEDRLIPCT